MKTGARGEPPSREQTHQQDNPRRTGAWWPALIPLVSGFAQIVSTVAESGSALNDG